MATPRKHWFKVADSIVRKLTIEQRGMLVSLMSVMNSRWARDGLRGEDAGRIILSHGELVTITGRSQVRFALKSLRSLAEVTSISVSLEGDFIEISWPKFAIFQGMESKSRVAVETDAVSAVPPPQDAPARRKTQDAEEKNQSASRRSSAAQADLGLNPEQNPDPGADAENATRSPDTPQDRRSLLAGTNTAVQAEIASQSATERKPKRHRKPPQSKPKPSHRAIAIFCEEYKAARHASAVVSPQAKPKLGEIFADVGMDEERLRAALRIFFAFNDPWIEDSSYSASAFCSIATKCFTWAEKRASAPKRPDPSQPPEDDSDRLTRDDMKLLFGDKK